MSINQMTPLLDHGLVRLIDSMGGDQSVVRAARVSYDAALRAGEDEGSDARLINYMMSHKHTTPFEACTVTFEVKAPIFVFRQWHRHRTQSYNELSARYRALPEEFYVPEPHLIGVQSKTDKQKRDITGEADAGAVAASKLIRDQNKKSFAAYRVLLNNGVPRELARSVLPCGTYSHMFCTMNLLNCMKFLQLRCDSHAQYEIRVYADAMLELIRPLFPVTIAAFEKHVLKRETD